MEKINRKWFIIPQKNKTIRLPRNPLLTVFAAIAIYSMIIPTVFVDITAQIYQVVYFSIMHIPKIKRSDYLVFDRQRISTLNPMQKLGCIYCSYVNGILAWAKALANQTEIYSCAIKHSTKREGQEHQEEYYEINNIS
ncbi:hypothetical protein JW978_03690 [Candidatus Dojkabacteria bacterium]|nr:hypothetical protein [Candidatus Dojkabacteria bacterium]